MGFKPTVSCSESIWRVTKPDLIQAGVSFESDLIPAGVSFMSDLIPPGVSSSPNGLQTYRVELKIHLACHKT